MRDYCFKHATLAEEVRDTCTQELQELKEKMKKIQENSKKAHEESIHNSIAEFERIAI